MSLSARVVTPALLLSTVAIQESFLSSLVTKASDEIVEVGSKRSMDSRLATVSRMSPSTLSTWSSFPIMFPLLMKPRSSCRGLAAVGLVRKGYSVQRSNWIVIHAAAGGVGLLATQLVRILGTHIIGTVSTEEKTILAKAAGAEHVVPINNGYEALEKKINEFTNGQGVHAAWDSIGKALFEFSLNIVRRLGTLVLYGHASGIILPFLLIRLADKNVKVTWADLEKYITTREEFDELYGELAEYLAKGQLKVDIHKVYSFDEAQQAHLDLEGRKSTGKLLIKNRLDTLHSAHICSLSLSVL
ncbi:NADPH:quinone reductase [Haplosporangium gracile]|nr:NADPH:quinone reductase [Haplosporangium gracile]